MNVMRINLPRLLVYGALCFSAIACTRPEVGGHQRVLLPWPDGAGSYTLQEVEVNTLHNVNEVRGDAADIFIDPSMQGQSITGARPSAHYIESESGLIVPRSFHSSQYFGLYAHAEKLWEFDKLVGAANILTRPRKYGFGVRERAGSTSQNNAYFLNALDATFILPFDGESHPADKQLPMSLNAGILGHEHFHSLFYAKTNRFQSDSEVAGCQYDQLIHENEFLPRHTRHQVKRKDWNQFLLQALNEGLADIWGWLYSNDLNFISHSVPKAASIRSLAVMTSGPSWTKTSYSVDRMHPTNGFDDTDVYELGTYIARKIRSDSLNNRGQQSVDIRLALAKHIILQLNQFDKLIEAIRVSSGQSELEISSVIKLFTLPESTPVPESELGFQ